jgi:PhzF family phenazine biosynthesis protein
VENIEIYHIDAFTDKVFHGNPAAICLVSNWLNDELLQAIAMENNLSETAFVMQDMQGYQIRWFTPKGEVSLCGHATLAAGFLLFELDRCPEDVVTFSSLSGPLTVRRQGERLVMDFPRLNYQEINASDVLTKLIDKPILGLYSSDLDHIILLEDERQVLNARVDLRALSLFSTRGLILTAVSQDADFYSRCFYPKHNIPEDPVTGSAHCVLAPFWADRLNKTRLQAIQGSVRRGEIFCEVVDNRVHLSGSCRWFSKGHLVI